VQEHRDLPADQGPGRPAPYQGRLPDAAPLKPALPSRPSPARSTWSRRARSDLAWRVSVNTVADSMRRQGLKGRKVKRNKGLDPAGQDRPEVSGPAQAGLHRSRDQYPLGQGHHRDPDGRGQAVLGDGARPVLAPAAGRADLGAPERRACVRRDQDGCGGSRRRLEHRPGHLPHRPRLDLHGWIVHHLVRRVEVPTVDGQSRVVLRYATAEAFSQRFVAGSGGIAGRPGARVEPSARASPVAASGW